MFFIKIILNTKEEFQALDTIQERESLQEYFIRYQAKHKSSSVEIEKIESYIGTDANFSQQKLFWVECSLPLANLQEFFPSFTRILIKVETKSDVKNINNLAIHKNAFTNMMNNAPQLMYPQLDGRPYLGENQLWNKIVECLKATKAGFRNDESKDMASFMKILDEFQ